MSQNIDPVRVEALKDQAEKFMMKYGHTPKAWNPAKRRKHLVSVCEIIGCSVRAMIQLETGRICLDIKSKEVLAKRIRYPEDYMCIDIGKDIEQEKELLESDDPCFVKVHPDTKNSGDSVWLTLHGVNLNWKPKKPITKEKVWDEIQYLEENECFDDVSPAVILDMLRSYYLILVKEEKIGTDKKE